MGESGVLSLIIYVAFYPIHPAVRWMPFYLNHSCCLFAATAVSVCLLSRLIFRFSPPFRSFECLLRGGRVERPIRHHLLLDTLPSAVSSAGGFAGVVRALRVGWRMGTLGHDPLHRFECWGGWWVWGGWRMGVSGGLSLIF